MKEPGKFSRAATLMSTADRGGGRRGRGAPPLGALPCARVPCPDLGVAPTCRPPRTRRPPPTPVSPRPVSRAPASSRRPCSSSRCPRRRRALGACRGGERRADAPHARRLARHATTRARSTPRSPPTCRPGARWATCSTGSRASRPTRASSRRSPTRWDVSPDGLDVHVPPAAGRHVPRRHALRARARGARAGSACSTRRRAAAAAGRSTRSRARASSPRARRPRVAGPRARRRQHASSSRSTEPLAIFPKLLAMPVAAIVPDRSAPTSASSRSAPARGSSWSGSTTTTSSSRATRRTGAARRRPTRCIARIIPEPSTAVAEFESGNVDVLHVPEGETRSWEQTDERSARLAERARAAACYYVGDQHDARPAHGRARAPGDQPRDRRARRSSSSCWPAAAASPPASIPPTLDGADTTRAPLRVRHRARASSCSPRPATRTASTSSSGARRTPPFPRIAQTHPGLPARRRHPREARAARRGRACARPRATGRRTCS